MSIWSSDKRIRRLTLDGLLIAVSMMLSYLEVLLPLDLLLPLPGFKLGLANLITVFAFVAVSKLDAGVILVLRVSLMGLLFGTPISFFLSVSGAIFCYAVLWISSVCLRKCSYLGVSVLCAFAHNAGQLVACCLTFGTSVIWKYLPVLAVAALISGALTGTLLNLSVPTLSRLAGKERA